MSISRRQFILGTGSGLVLPSYYDKVFSFFENHREPLIESPKQAATELYAVAEGGNIEFHLGEVAFQDLAYTAWESSHSPMAMAYHLLEGLNLGPDFNSENAVGRLDFIKNPCYSSSYRGVHTKDPVSLSLLQKRLNDLNTGIRVSLVGTW